MEEKFQGFPEPKENYWQYPRCLNGWWHILSGSEQKVLDYIVRHTWGYQKTTDNISLSQFKKGIKSKKTGEWIDKGIGIKKNETILNAIKKLEKTGFIETEQRRGKTKTFKLRLLTKTDNTYHQNGLVTYHQNGHTIEDCTIDNKTIPPIPLKGGETDSSLNSSFNGFWNSYPRKVAKPAALKAWKKLKPTDSLLKIILKDIEKKKTSEQWEKNNGQFIPHPSTYLNQRRWEDEVETKPNLKEKLYYGKR